MREDPQTLNGPRGRALNGTRFALGAGEA